MGQTFHKVLIFDIRYLSTSGVANIDGEVCELFIILEFLNGTFR